MGKKIMEAFIGSGVLKKPQESIVINAEIVRRTSTNRIGIIF
ncbi:MAG: hypothetical protein ABI581_17280 [Sediminibacterium sp.]